MNIKNLILASAIGAVVSFNGAYATEGTMYPFTDYGYEYYQYYYGDEPADTWYVLIDLMGAIYDRMGNADEFVEYITSLKSLDSYSKNWILSELPWRVPTADKSLPWTYGNTLVNLEKMQIKPETKALLKAAIDGDHERNQTANKEQQADQNSARLELTDPEDK